MIHIAVRYFEIKQGLSNFHTYAYVYACTMDTEAKHLPTERCLSSYVPDDRRHKAIQRKELIYTLPGLETTETNICHQRELYS